MQDNRFTLLELSNLIGESVRNSFPYRYWIIAEINEIRENVNGHCYLELIQKDTDQDRIVAISKATIWAYTWRMLRPFFETSTSQTLTRGMMILIEVTVEYHELYGLSLNVKDIDPVYTLGDLERKRAQTLKKLQEEGISDMNKSIGLPDLPSRIAVISSASAAGYEDFMHQVINNPVRYKISFTLFPALMQGENAARSVTLALDEIFEKSGMFDLVVILRGGGSTTDLNCFDSYEVASHIAQFPLPVITGIGHERDITIAGMVAHTNLKTPTAVAGFILEIFRKEDLRIENFSEKFVQKVERIIELNRQKIKAIVKYLPPATGNLLKDKSQSLFSMASVLTGSSAGFLQTKRYSLETVHTHFSHNIRNYFTNSGTKEKEIREVLLPGKIRVMLRNKANELLVFATTTGLVDPERLLKKGYSLLLKNGQIVKNAKEVNKDDVLETKLHDGRIKSRVLEVLSGRKDILTS